MKLSNITGYEQNWPKKRYSGLAFGQTFEKTEDYFCNLVVDQTSSLGIGIDEEILTSLMWQSFSTAPGFYPVNAEKCFQIAKALASQSQKFLRIEKE